MTTIDETDLFDVTIIGGGPAGLFSTFYSGLREMKTKLIEYHPYLGGKLNLYPEKFIWDIGGLPPQPAAQVIDNLIEQAQFFNPTIVTKEKIVSIEKSGKIFSLIAESGNKHYSKTIIMATGYGLLTPVKLTIEGAETFELTNLLYTIQNPLSLKGKRVVISGGGNAAVDWANLLEPIAAEVHLVYRKEALKGHEAAVTKLLTSSVIYHKNHDISALIADEDNSSLIKKVDLKDTLTGVTKEVAVDVVVINHGYDSERTIFEENTIGLTQFEEYYIKTESTNMTEIPGVFAAGDVVMHDGKLHLIAGAFQDACNAVNHAKLFIEPEADAWGRVSSHNASFAEENKQLVEEFFS